MNSINVFSPPPGVRFFDLSPGTIVALWNKMKGFDPLFSDDNRWDVEKFHRSIYDRGTLVLEIDNGVLLLTGMKPGHYALVHACFWDHKVSARLQLLKDTIIWAFVTFDLIRLEAFIPGFSRALSRILSKKLGFTFEGKLRKRMKYHGTFCDVLVYSLLREEMEEWDRM